MHIFRNRKPVDAGAKRGVETQGTKVPQARATRTRRCSANFALHRLVRSQHCLVAVLLPLRTSKRRYFLTTLFLCWWKDATMLDSMIDCEREKIVLEHLQATTEQD